MNWKLVERIMFIGIIIVLLIYIVSPYVYFFGEPKPYETFTMGTCYSIEDYSIRIENITYHCSYINADNKQHFVGESVIVGLQVDGISFSVNSIEFMEGGS